jgi:hypothetical protein
MIKYSVWFIGALICAWGITAILRPDLIKRVVDFLMMGWRWRLSAAIKVIIGIIFLIFARECRLPGVIITLGILMIVGSLTALTVDPARFMNKWMQFVQQWPLWGWRCWGIMAVIFGGLILYAG